jgi:tetratricopeptide (TPR) repeat protein
MSDLETLRAKALELLVKGDTAGGITDLKQVVAEDPDDAEAWLHLGTAYASIHHTADAATALRRAVELDGGDVDARLAYARALVRLGKLDDAAFQLLQASKVDPSDARVLKELGVVFYDKRLYDKAATWLLKATAASPMDGRAHYALGLVFEAKRDIGAAIAEYREAVRCDPGLLDARMTLADALASIGEHEAAIGELTALLDADRRNEQAARNREILERALVEMRSRRLLGRTTRELEQSALFGEAQFRKKEGGRVEEKEVLRFVAPMTELYVTLGARPDEPGSAPKPPVTLGAGEERSIEALMLVLVDPAKAARVEDEVFKVTVIGKDGSRKAANYATGASITFVREALGCPMTQASELYARLVGGEPSVEWGGAILSFASAPRPDKPSEMKNGILATLKAAR